MHPVLFRIGSQTVGTHDFFVFLGILAGSIVFFYEARRRRMFSEQVVWVVIGALFGGVIGAKLSSVWTYVATAPDPSIPQWLLAEGRSILGALAGAYLGAVLAKRLIGYRLPTGDLFAPAVALGMAIGRWGCFLTEQVGTATSLPWGITVSREAAAAIPNCPACLRGVPMHPSFLYEIVFQAAMFGLLLWLRPRVRTAGDLFKIYLLAYAVFRFAVEFVRGNEVVWAGLTGPQLFLIPTTLLLLGYFALHRFESFRWFRRPDLKPGFAA
jgi:phosphatidylglycerol---prolipoprotein diacylglyceryl transferase